jgi:hypothetical protein
VCQKEGDKEMKRERERYEKRKRGALVSTTRMKKQHF